MDTIRTFRDLVAWKLGKQTVNALYRYTQQMPESERFGMTGQMRRAAISIPSSIAEGDGLGMTAGFLRHLRIARGSIFELDTQLEIATDLGFLPRNPDLIHSLEETDRLLQGLRRSLEKKLAPRQADT